MREKLEERENRMADDRHINYEMLSQKGTKLYFASLKAKDTSTKIKTLGTDGGETTDPLEITMTLQNHFTDIFSSKQLQTSIFDHMELQCIKDIISTEQKDFLNTDYMPAEIYHATNKLREASIPGMDGMTGKITKLIATKDIKKIHMHR